MKIDTLQWTHLFGDQQVKGLHGLQQTRLVVRTPVTSVLLSVLLEVWSVQQHLHQLQVVLRHAQSQRGVSFTGGLVHVQEGVVQKKGLFLLLFQGDAVVERVQTTRVQQVHELVPTLEQHFLGALALVLLPQEGLQLFASALFDQLNDQVPLLVLDAVVLTDLESELPLGDLLLALE